VICNEPVATETVQADSPRHLAKQTRDSAKSLQIAASSLFRDWVVDVWASSRIPKLCCVMLVAICCSFLVACSDYNDARSAYAAGRHEEAFNKLFKLAKEGHLKAQYEVAMMFNNGIGVAKDKEEAWNWFIRAAKGGNVDAQVELGAHYEAGADGQPNGIMAAQWWKTAAKNGSGVAAFNLGTMYRAGRVTARDLVRAYAWFMVAEDLGVITAKDHLRNLRDLIPEQDVAKAERMKDGLLKEEAAPVKG
jgi:TPR repeat protein